jgi:ABC-2 type transport system ATP-binding protein
MQATRREPLIEIRELVKDYGSQRALDGLSLTVASGDALGLLGPNGAGKTTTLRILSTQAAPSAGQVRILGLDPRRDADAIRARIGVVPQEIALYEGLSARENLEFFGAMRGLAGARLRERVDWALDCAGLAERARERVETYSGGMKRRLNIVTALLSEPELVFLDEPTVGIDPQSRNHVYEMVEGLRREGTTIVYTTHQLGEVERLCNRIAILDRGRLVALGSLDELCRLELGLEPKLTRIQVGARVGEVLELLHARQIEAQVEEHLPNLEEVFLALTGRALRDAEQA